jgi:hypothetical protein
MIMRGDEMMDDGWDGWMGRFRVFQQPSNDEPSRARQTDIIHMYAYDTWYVGLKVPVCTWGISYVIPKIMVSSATPSYPV